MYAAALTVSVEGVRESSLLSGVDGQVVVVLDLNPSNDVGALEGLKRGKPGGGILVALGLVEVVGDSDQLGTSEVICELLTESSRPIAGSAYPGFFQRNHVVLEISWLGHAMSKI